MTRHQHLKAFKEAILRCSLIRKDLDKINTDKTASQPTEIKKRIVGDH